MQDNLCITSRNSIMLLLQVSTIVLIGFFESSGATEQTQVVHTTFGPVQGSIFTTHNSVTYAAFQSIPYAKPPLGNLRFKPPVDPVPWTEVYNATPSAPDCSQINPFNFSVVGSEDCLYLRVAIPTSILVKKRSFPSPEEETKCPKELKPVIIWIYGGAYLGGSSTFTRYTPDNVIEQGIIYVAFNYRSGPFGYLSLNHPNATGNAGLKDLVHGLKWVQKNIAKFCGNPKNVTIMGQSSGAASIGYLVLSSSAAGLFQAAISMSGAPLNYWAFKNTTECVRRAHMLTDNLGIEWSDPDTLLKKLYDVPAADLVTATANISLSFGPFGPTVENESIATEPVLTECSVTKYLTGRFNQVPHLMGFEAQETLSFVSLPAMTWPMIENYIAAAQLYHMDVPESIWSAKKQLEQYNMSYFADSNNKELFDFINETSAVLFNGGIDQTQRFLAANNRNYPIYYYCITFYSGAPHAPAWNNTLLGPGHSDDLSFLYYNPLMNYSTSLTTAVGRTIYRVTKMWTNFAKYGHPTPNWLHDDGYPLGINWPDSGISGLTLDIGNELTIKPRFTTDAMSKYENSSWKYLSEATQCDCNSSISFTVPLKTGP